MKACLIPLLLVFLLISDTNSLFTSAPTNNFTISGLNVSQPHLVIDGSGTKILLWSMYPSQVQIHTTNGTSLCSLNSTNVIQNVLWPSNSGPLVYYTIGSVIDTLDESTCLKTKSFNLSQIINVPLERFYLNKVDWIDNRLILAASGIYAVYEIDLEAQKLMNSYKENSQTITNQIEKICYSGDFSHLYVLTLQISDTSMTVKIYDTKKENEGSLKEVKMPEGIQIVSMAPSKDKSSIILYGLSVVDFSTVILTLDSAGTLLTRITRIIWKPVLLITDTNLFDSATFFNPEFLTIELLRVLDGNSLQAFPFPDMEAIKGAEYKNKTMAIVMNSSQVLTYSYQLDQDTKPDDEGGSPVVWIIVGVVLGVIVIGAAVFFIIKKKKMFKKQEENYGKLQDQV